MSAFLSEVRDLDPTVRACASSEALLLCPVLSPDYVAAAVIEPNSSDIDVNAVHQGYLRGFKAKGGRIVTDARVTAVDRDGPAWTVRTSAENFTCATVVNAAGAWADELALLARCAPVGLVPKRRTAFTFAAEDFRRWPCVLDMDETFYFKPDGGRVMGSPGDETPSPPCDVQPEDIDIAVAVDRIEGATTLRIARIAAKWAGLRTFARDKVPVVGMDRERAGFFWLAGQGGYGIMTSPALSEFAASLVLGESIPPQLAAYGIFADTLSPARFAV